MAENEKNFVIVDTDEAGQITGMRRMESGDTISNDRLNTDIRDAGSNATTALNKANEALSETASVSSTVYINSGTWGTGEGLDATTLANLTNASNAIADFSGASGTFATCSTGQGVIVDADINGTADINGSKLADDTVTFAKLPNISTGEILGRDPLGAGDGPITALTPANARDNLGILALGLKNKIDDASLLGSQVVDPSSVKDNSITNSQLAGGAAVANIGTNGITSNEIGPSAVTAAKINENAITADKIVNGTITTTELKSDAGITSDQLAGNITLGKLATTTPNGIIGTGSDSQPAMITATDARSNMGLGNLAILDAVTTSQIVSGAVQTTNILDGGVTTVKIAADAIDGTKIADDAVSTEHIVDDAIQTAQIKNGKVTNDKLAGEIPQHKLASSGISKINITGTSGVFMSGSQGGDAAPVPGNGAVMVIDTAAGRLKFTDTISGAKLDDGTIDDTKLAAGAAQGNIGINELTFAQLPSINAESFVGNNNSMGSNMKQFTAAQAKTILDIGGSYSVGTTAPTSPTGGDLWYNTTDDELYTYDSGRAHWLGAPHYISLGKTTSTAPGVGHYLYVGHAGTTATTQERGWLVPHDMVITGWRGHTKSTFTGWTFRIDKNSGGTNTTGIVSTGALGAVDTFSDFTLDVDVAAGDILGVPGVTGTSTIDNSTVIIKIQRKGA